MPTPLQVLLLEDQSTDAALILKELRRAGYEPVWERVDTEEEYARMLGRDWDIILSDFSMPQFNGLQALEMMRTRGLEIPFIIISGTIGEDAAVSAIKQGASDYFLKDRLARLGSAVSHAIDQNRLRAERHSANEALRESEERFRQLAEHIGEVFWLFDVTDNRTLYISPAYQTIWGRPRPAEGSLRSAWLDTVHPEDRERVTQVLSEEKGPAGFDIEYRIIRPDGTVRWIHDRAFAVHGASNDVRRIAGLARDITEHKEAEESLRLLSSALEQSRESIVITDTDLESPGPRIVFVNGGFTKMTGYEAAEVLGKSPRLLQGPQTDREVVMRLRNQLKAGEVFFGETVNYRKDGTPFNMEWRVAPVRNTSGVTTHFVAVQRDITERKRAEQELHWKTAFLEAQVNSSSDGILVIDGSGRQILKNERLSEIWKAPPCMLEGLHDGEATHWASLLTTNPEGFRKRVEFLYKHPDITANDEIQLLDGRTIDRYSAPVLGKDGIRYGRIWKFRDITNRKLDEYKLKEQAALIDEARDAILVRSLDHRILFWSKGAERLYGWTNKEAVGKQANELLYRKQASFLEATKITVEQGEWRGELQQLTKTGESLTVESRWTLLRDEAGQPKSVLAINSDITERKKVEEQFLRAQRLESIGTLAGGIAHDLNNVLSPILMGASLLKMQSGEDDSNAQILDLIEKSVRRGSELVKQVLSFARGVEGARVAVHIGDVINELSGIIQSTFPKHINFTSSVSDEIWTIESDPTQIHQVFLNLCVNARDAMPNGGTLSIYADNVTIDAQYAAQQSNVPEGSYVRVRISDTGTGIAKENMEKIFEPFFTTKEIGKGTGLGLSTTLGIIRSNGGAITVESEMGEGTTFTLHLPVPGENRDRLAEVARHGDDLYGRGECVLLVDDERAILSITRQTLKSYGYEVLTAENGAQALGIFAEHRHEIAVVVMDMMMPVLSGPASIVAMRHLDPDVKIIATSGLKEKGNSGLESTVNVEHFLSKPYSAKVLLTTLRQCIGSSPNLCNTVHVPDWLAISTSDLRSSQTF
ncbi:MAG TPA: PAS domain S-box protein [Candidatus Methylacidiphilales bacterium]|nr:PAS domain S-box protein [Candidatus Methylacidiphilales bacterium]